MFNWFKKKEKEKEYSFKWYEVGEGNPFNKKILDIRSFTGTMFATTPDKSIAEKYNTLRYSVGKEFIGVDVSNETKTIIDLEYPHNGAKLEGAAFKADSMDCKWDIYVYDEYFYFARSWTGDLVYKVKTTILQDKIKLTEISHSRDIDSKEAKNGVHFLMKSHAFGQPFPHMVPSNIIGDEEIAMWSFSQFGNRACYATYNQITDTLIKTKE